jgi:LysR family glycine cleavage system transcriptional activator
MKLPPMNALRTFEAVSRHGSVSKAAEELCVSQGAVSQQLRNLEDYFGKELFQRSANSFALTEEGEEFAAVVQLSLGQVAAAATKISRDKSQHTLRISAPHTITTKWLMPKLGQFYEAHPGVSVILDESLITIKVFAVASPAYIEKHGRLESAENPVGHCLIDHFYDSKNISSQHIHWRDIVDGNLDEMGVEHMVYPDGLQSFNAAIHGQGIALVSTYMFEDEVDAGNLVILSENIYEYRNGYYFVTPTGARPNQELDHFRDWLVEISKSHRDG